jgi:glutathione S-transferase
MYKLHGYQTQNNKKALYVLEELGLNYEFIYIDLFKGEHKTEYFLKMNPLGKVPVLEHDKRFLFESGAICRYLANQEENTLFPKDSYQRAVIDQWMEFFTNHLGLWINTLFFQRVLKVENKMGDTNEEKCLEAEKFLPPQLKVLNVELSKNKYISGENLTIADLVAFAYIEQIDKLDMTLEEYPSLLKWKEEISKRDSIKKVNSLFQ